MTKDAASFLFYVVGAAVALTFAGAMLTLAWPIFSMPGERPPVEYKR